MKSVIYKTEVNSIEELQQGIESTADFMPHQVLGAIDQVSGTQQCFLVLL